jgi:PIN domain nuclease of toxin-antitoxin system
MRLLLDTHALLWFLEGDARLSDRARVAIEDSSHERWVSVASGWEMVIKADLGKLRLPLPFRELFPARLEQLGFSILSVGPGHVQALQGMPRHHTDPFDRMLAAQVLVEGMTLVGIDAAFDAYGISRLW